MLNQFEQIKLGNGLDETVDMGPVASPSQFDTVSSYIAKGIAEGAVLLFWWKPFRGSKF